MAGFEMGKDWERAVQRATEAGLNDTANRYQRMFDDLLRRYRGRPVGEIKPPLMREWRRLGGSLSDAEATQYAQHISDGTRIVMRVDKPRW